MKIKRMVSALALAAGLAISVPSLASTFGLSSQTMTSVQAADGWQRDDGGVFYLQNDTRVTGLKDIDGATYYFNANGYRFTGAIKLDKYTYYFHPESGKLCKGYAGLYRIGDNSNDYYFFLNSKKGRVAVNTWVKSKGKYYYAGADGRIQLGTIKVKGKLYHVTPKGRMTSYGRSSYDGKYYNASSKGILLTGLRKVKGKQYYFDKKTGERVSGLVKVGKSTFYFNEKTGTAKTGWVKADDKTYYYLSNYKRASGWKTINKKRYYFNPKNGCARQEFSWLKIGKSYYYFDANGVVETGFFRVGADMYYANTKGARKTGWVTVNGRKYFFGPKTGVMQTGWLTYQKAKYYLTPSSASKTYGAAITGWSRTNDGTYYFNSDGRMQTGWLQQNDVKYYFDKTTGKMVTGKRTIDGKLYDFGTNGKIKVSLTGPWSIKVQRGTASNGYQCFVVVYRGNTAVKAFVCSTARAGCTTPAGTFTIKDKLYWHELMGPTWGQYCSHITSDILFHSVPNTSYNNPYTLETSEYNKLGTAASAGCIRLSVKHAKWLFDNVPVGTKVTVSNKVTKPSNIEIEKVPKQNLSKSYDPTDTFQNPYSVR